MRFRFLILISVSVAIVAPGAASASELIDRNATDVKLSVSRTGQAVVSYKARGKRWNVLAWSAINAIPPTTARPQVKFRLDYSGGWGTYHRDVWKTLRNACVQYDGPPLKWFVTGCKAADGSYWAVQSWQRMLPNYGLTPSPAQAVRELRLSHWCGPLPELTVNLNWAYRKYHHVFGSFTYLGQPVYGFKSTPGGNPLDTFGRNLYVDTLDSAYGAGWKRENSFLMHRNTRQVLLRLLPARQPPGRGRHALPRDDHRPRRDARHLVGGEGARAVRPGVRSAHARGAEGVLRRRLPLPRRLAALL